MTRVLVWATHLQTDILALSLHLDRSPDIELLIVADQAAIYLQEPIARAAPLRAQVLDRNDPGTLERVRAFAADVAVADNHVPPRGVAPRLFYMWHGLGWKARSRLDLKVFYQQVRLLTGQDPRRPAGRFRAQCYGPTDLAWRVGNWGIAAGNCVVAGMCFSDLLLDPPYDLEEIAPAYGIDVVRRKTVLLSITWHYGGVFARNGKGSAHQAFDRDMQFIRTLAAEVLARGANLLICLHDRKRYDSRLLRALEEVAQGSDSIEIRFKSEHPDNLADLLVADVMVSNLSSFLAYHYVLKRPSVHIVPAPAEAKRIERVIMLLSRFRIRVGTDAGTMWMLDPRDTGGVSAIDDADVIQAVGEALDNPESGAAAAADWLARHVLPIDGKACQRMEEAIKALCRQA